MKRYARETTFLLLQLCIFYLLPLFVKAAGPIGTVLLIIASTFALSLFLGSISAKKIKYLYPIAISLLFIPSVFIFYNESALIHAVWYLAISGIGIAIGSLIRRLFCTNKHLQRRLKKQ